MLNLSELLKASYLALLTVYNAYFRKIGSFPMFPNSLMPKIYIISFKYTGSHSFLLITFMNAMDLIHVYIMAMN